MLPECLRYIVGLLANCANAGFTDSDGANTFAHTPNAIIPRITITDFCSFTSWVMVLLLITASIEFVSLKILYTRNIEITYEELTTLVNDRYRDLENNGEKNIHQKLKDEFNLLRRFINHSPSHHL